MKMNNAVKFGEWLREARVAQDLGVRDLAALTNVDSSTISRTENHKTETSLYTVYKLCSGLNVPARGISTSLGIDSTAFLYEDFFEPPYTLMMLVEEVGLHTRDEQSFLLDASVRLHRLFPKTSFATEMIQSYLHPLPAFRPLEMAYPPSSNSRLFNVYAHGEPLLVADVETYTYQSRKKTRTHLPIGSLRLTGCIGAGSSLERTSIDAIVRYDNEAQEQGAVFGMFWQACRFYECFGESEQMLRTATLCLLLHRWEGGMK